MFYFIFIYLMFFRSSGAYQLLQVLLGEVGQRVDVDLLVHELVHVLAQPQTAQPHRNVYAWHTTRHTHNDTTHAVSPLSRQRDAIAMGEGHKRPFFRLSSACPPEPRRAGDLALVFSFGGLITCSAHQPHVSTARVVSCVSCAVRVVRWCVPASSR